MFSHQHSRWQLVGLGETEKYLKLQNELEQKLRKDFDYKGEMKFYF